MKQLLIIFFITTSVFVQAQNSISPYSFLGPGEIQKRGFGTSLGMGGGGIALPSGNGTLNALNPASYTGIDSLRIVSEFGIEGKAYQMSSSDYSQMGFTGNLDYVALGFRVTPWMSSSFGVAPFSSVGYNIIDENYVSGLNSTYTSTFTGSGGISQFYLSNAFKLFKNLSVGVNASYMFGPLTQEENIGGTSIVPTTKILRMDAVKSLYFDYGLQYAFKKRKTNYSFGITFSNKQWLKSSHTVSLYDADLSLLSSETYDTDYLTIPATVGIGFGIQNTEKFTLALDYNFQNWEGVEYPSQTQPFVNSHEFVLGGEIRPGKYRAVNSFYKNLTYRFGLNYGTSYLEYRNSVVTDKSISAGVGVPLPGRISNVNLSVTTGINGTSKSNIIKEKYCLFNLGFSLNEIAFIKRKFD